MMDTLYQSLIIPQQIIAQRLDQLLATLLPDYSRTQIQRWIRGGTLLMNGRLCQAKTHVKGGERISLALPPDPVTLAWEPEAIPLSIVYEDEALLIINKPVGMLVHPGAGHPSGTLLNALLHYDPNLKILPRAGIVHRLDKETAGLLAIAKTATALKQLSIQLKQRTLLREYQAIVIGQVTQSGRVCAPIGRHPKQRQRMAVVAQAKEAITYYNPLEQYCAHTLLKVKLETGRTHQIRVHMAYLNHPIVGDPTYGQRLWMSKSTSPQLVTCLRAFHHQALCACRLGMIHPMSHQPTHWEITLPTDMQHLIHCLREDLTLHQGGGDRQR